MTSPAAFTAGVAAGLAVAVPLGAVGALVLDTGLRHGTRPALAAGLGVATMDGVYAAAAALAGASVAAALAPAQGAIRLVAASVLAVVALALLRGALRPRPARARALTAPALAPRSRRARARARTRTRTRTRTRPALPPVRGAHRGQPTTAATFAAVTAGLPAAGTSARRPPARSSWARSPPRPPGTPGSPPPRARPGGTWVRAPGAGPARWGPCWPSRSPPTSPRPEGCTTGRYPSGSPSSVAASSRASVRAGRARPTVAERPRRADGPGLHLVGEHDPPRLAADDRVELGEAAEPLQRARARRGARARPRVAARRAQAAPAQPRVERPDARRGGRRGGRSAGAGRTASAGRKSVSTSGSARRSAAAAPAHGRARPQQPAELGARARAPAVVAPRAPSSPARSAPDPALERARRLGVAGLAR